MRPAPPPLSVFAANGKRLSWCIVQERAGARVPASDLSAVREAQVEGGSVADRKAQRHTAAPSRLERCGISLRAHSFDSVGSAPKLIDTRNCRPAEGAPSPSARAL
jgi:hypothetical protein